MPSHRHAPEIRRISSLPGLAIGCHERTMPKQRRFHGALMITTSEYAVTIIIWVLTLAGVFFGGRAAWRRRKRKHAGGKNQ
jgi:hypothetical protein